MIICTSFFTAFDLRKTLTHIPAMLQSTVSGNIRRTLSQDLEVLRARAELGPLTLGQLEAALHGRGFLVMILLCSLPFVLPIPIPGLSIPFGLVICVLGFRLMLGQRPWLPQRMLSRELSPAVMARMLNGGLRLARVLERFARVRLTQISRWAFMRNLTGAAIFIEGIVLSMPPPMINAIPAISLVALTAGVLEEDGVLILLGYIATFLSLIYLALLVALGRAGIEKVLTFF